MTGEHVDKLYFGNYRGEVVANADSLGRCRIYVEGIYPKELKEKGSHQFLPMAEPAMPLTFGDGRGDSTDTRFSATWAAGHCAWPSTGALVWVFFEGGDHNYPVYFANIPAGEAWTSNTPGQTEINSRGMRVTVEESLLEKTTSADVAKAKENILDLQSLETNANPPEENAEISAATDSAFRRLIAEQDAIIASTASDDEKTKATALKTILDEPETVAGSVVNVPTAIKTITSGFITSILKKISNVLTTNPAVDVSTSSNLLDGFTAVSELIANPPNPSNLAYKAADKYVKKYQSLITDSKDEIISKMLPAASTSTDEDVTKKIAALQSLSKADILKALQETVDGIPLTKQLFNLQKTAAGKLGFTSEDMFKYAMQLLQLVSMTMPGVTAPFALILKQMMNTITGSKINIIYDEKGKPTLQVYWGGDVEFYVNGDISTFQNGTDLRLKSGTDISISGPGTNVAIPSPISIDTILNMISGASEGAGPAGALTSALESLTPPTGETPTEPAPGPALPTTDPDDPAEGEDEPDPAAPDPPTPPEPLSGVVFKSSMFFAETSFEESSYGVNSPLGYGAIDEPCSTAWRNSMCDSIRACGGDTLLYIAEKLYNNTALQNEIIAHVPEAQARGVTRFIISLKNDNTNFSWNNMQDYIHQIADMYALSDADHTAFMTCLETDEPGVLTLSQTLQVIAWCKQYAPDKRVIVGSQNPSFLRQVANATNNAELWLEGPIFTQTMDDHNANVYISNLQGLKAHNGGQRVWAGEYGSGNGSNNANQNWSKTITVRAQQVGVAGIGTYVQ